MNPLQTGTPASQLAPQGVGYKNSSQTGTIQSTLNSSNVQTSTDEVLRVPASGKLKVVVPQNNTVLGASDTAATTTQATSGGGVSTLAIVALIGSAVLTVYFFKRFRKFLTTEPEDNDQD